MILGPRPIRSSIATTENHLRVHDVNLESVDAVAYNFTSWQRNMSTVKRYEHSLVSYSSDKVESAHDSNREPIQPRSAINSMESCAIA